MRGCIVNAGEPSGTEQIRGRRATQPAAWFQLTRHARERMVTRGIKLRAVYAALWFGRVASVRGAEIYAIGRKEVELYAREGIDLAAFEGTQVVVAPGGHVVTVYRNRDFRGLKSRGPAWRDAA